MEGEAHSRGVSFGWLSSLGGDDRGYDAYLGTIRAASSLFGNGDEGRERINTGWRRTCLLQVFSLVSKQHKTRRNAGIYRGERRNLGG